MDEGFSKRLRSQMREPRDLLKGGRLHSVVALLSHHKVVNAEVECNFARANSAAKTTRGDWLFCCACCIGIGSDIKGMDHGP